MFEHELNHLRTRLEEIGRASKRFHLNRCATPDQVADYERKSGIILPEAYREFILQIGDGLQIDDGWETNLGVKSRAGRLWIAPLFAENNTLPTRYFVETSLVIFPFRFWEDGENSELHQWRSLTGHEMIESDIGLSLGLTGRNWDSRWVVLIVRGAERNKVWFPSAACGHHYQPSELPFLDALEWMINQAK